MAVNAGQRNVPDTPANTMFYAVDKARELATYTIQICSNTNVFNPKYAFITQKIINVAMSIYENSWTANNIIVNNADDWLIRRKFQKTSIAKCNALLAYIDLAKKLYHLRSKRVKYWAELTLQTRSYLREWNEKDQERYKNKK